MVEQLAREHQQELAAAGTFVALEELTAGIGDEFGRQLCENELTSRSERAANLEHCECPKCGLLCPRGEPEPMEKQATATPDEASYPAPKLVSREVVASGAEAESFGWQLAA